MILLRPVIITKFLAGQAVTLAIGAKERNRFFIAGEEVEL